MRFAQVFAPLSTAIVVSLGSSILFMQPNASLAQPAPSRSIPPGTSYENRILQQLNLNADQQQRIRTIQNQYASQQQALGQSLAQASRQFAQSMASDVPEAQVREQYRQVKTLQQQLGDLSFARLLAIRNVLTVEQRRQVATLLQQRPTRPPASTSQPTPRSSQP